MPDSRVDRDNGPTEDGKVTLELLSVIEANYVISQRALSNELGVALGLANAYLKRCVLKGLIKIKQVPRRRYAYYLTPQGFAEKARLTGEYLTSSMQFFRRTRGQFNAFYQTCEAKGLKRIALVGASEIAEIAIMAAYEFNVTLVGVVDPKYAKLTFCGLPVVRRMQDLDNIDAIFWMYTSDNAGLRSELLEQVGPDRLFIPLLVTFDNKRAPGKRADDVATSE